MLRRIFSHNQENFTGGQSVIPVITVLEEAQSVLGRQLEESSPFVEWVKEGRKYDLGAMWVFTPKISWMTTSPRVVFPAGAAR